ncbi:hypothetical protein K6V43_04325 [Streptococcus suis]|nr:hypothetical protein [Streptococcus suis]
MLYAGVLVFSNFLIPFLKQWEYKLRRQGNSEEADFQDLSYDSLGLMQTVVSGNTMEKIKFVKEIGYVILVAILLIAFIYRLGLSNVGKLELMIYVMFFSLALVHLLKRNKKK